MIEKIKKSYIKKRLDGGAIALPLHLQNLLTDGKNVGENSSEKKYIIFPSSRYQTEQHIMNFFYKNIF